MSSQDYTSMYAGYAGTYAAAAEAANIELGPEYTSIDQTSDQFAPQSIPSAPVNLVRIPSPTNFGATFIYNFFMPDENTNDTGSFLDDSAAATIYVNPVTTALGHPTGEGSAPLDIVPGEVTLEEKTHAGAIKASVPRWIELFWDPPWGQWAGVAENTMAGLPPGIPGNYPDLQLAKRKILEQLSNGTILDQSSLMGNTFNSTPFVDVGFQDVDLSSETYETMVSMDACLSTSWNAAAAADMFAVLQHFQLQPPASYWGGLQAGEYGTKWSFAEQLNGDNPNGTLQPWLESGTPGSVSDAVSGADSTVYYNPNSGDYAGSGTRTSAFDRVAMSGLFNGKFVGDIIKRMSNNPWGPFFKAISDDETWASLFQGATLSNANWNQIAEDEYHSLLPLSNSNVSSNSTTKTFDEADVFTTSNAYLQDIWFMGYIIEKYEIGYTGDGNVVYDSHSPIVVGGWQTTSAIDIRVKYGAVYYYRPRAVIMCEWRVHVVEDDKVYKTEVMFVSPAGPGIVVQASNDAAWLKPPAPPQDLRFIWDWNNEWLTVHWCLPCEPQQDIKYFKIYRRKSTYEPYQLLALYDFNDTEYKVFEGYDLVRPTLRHKTFKKYYRDREFTKDSRYIYAMVSVDAHGISSNYSTQFAVSWDAFRNRLRVIPLSPPGAPEPYPNFLLRKNVSNRFGQTDLTTDLVKATGRKRAYIFLNPLIPQQVSGIKGIAPSREHIITWAENAVGNKEMGEARGEYIMCINNLDMHKSRLLSLKIRGDEPLTV